MSRVIDCSCGHQLRAETDAALFQTVQEHATTVHAEQPLSDWQLTEILRDHAYTEGPLTNRLALTLVRRVFREVWEKADPQAAEEIFRSDYINHDRRMTETRSGPAGVMDSIAGYKAAFPDHHFIFHEFIVAGDRVVVRWSVDATHTGPFRGEAPTGKRVSTTGVTIFRIAGGKIAESWMYWDRLGLLQQLGRVPSLAEA